MYTLRPWQLLAPDDESSKWASIRLCVWLSWSKNTVEPLYNVDTLRMRMVFCLVFPHYKGTSLFLPIRLCSLRMHVEHVKRCLHTVVLGDLVPIAHCTSPSLPPPSTLTAPVPQPAPVMTEAHPMAKQRPTELPDFYSKPLFWSLYIIPRNFSMIWLYSSTYT